MEAPSLTTIDSESELKGKWENEETKPPVKSQLERVGVLPPTNKEERTHEEQNAQIKEKTRTRAYVFLAGYILGMARTKENQTK